MNITVPKKIKVSFVYPMYNEIGNIEKVIRSTHALGVSTLDAFEIVVVDDCSTDGCGKLADELAKEFLELRVIHHEQNRKLGGALKTGFAAARMDYILYMDSDIPVAFSDVESCLANLNEPFDILIGYRIGRAEGAMRHIQSWGYNFLLRNIFKLDVRDANFAFKLFRREVVSESLHSEGSFIDAELLLEALRRGYKIKEQGFQYHVRTAGVSTLGSPRVIPQLLGDLMFYWRKRWKRPLQKSRAVIFNADDFGLSKSINAGIVTSHQQGVVRSASIMVTGVAFDEAAQFALEKKTLDLGLHLTLCEGRPVCDPADVPSLISHDGLFFENHTAFLRRYLGGKISLKEVEKEFRAQLNKAIAASLHISHLDSHQHLHALPSVFEIVLRLAKECGIPAVRRPDELDASMSAGRPMRTLQRIALSLACRVSKTRIAKSGIACPDQFFGFMQMGRWDERSLRAAIGMMRPGITEICCHPSSERGAESGCDFQKETETFVGEELKRILKEENVRVTSFREAFAAAVV